MKRPNVLENSKGYGLVESLIAIAIIGLALSAFASLMNMQAQGYKIGTENMDIIQLRSSLISNLSLSGQCSCNFKNVSLASAQAAISDVSQFSIDPTTSACVKKAPLVTVGPQTQSSLNVSSIVLQNINQLSTTVFSADLVVKFAQGAGYARRPIQIPRMLFDTGAGLITSCRTTNKNRITKLQLATSLSPVPMGHSKFPGWGLEEIDELGAYDPAAPTRLTVPPGVSRIRLSLTYCWENNAGGIPYHRTTYIVKNDSWGIGNHPAIDEYESNGTFGVRVATQAVSPPLDVVPGDFFEANVYVTHPTETILNKGSCNTESTFVMEALE